MKKNNSTQRCGLMVAVISALTLNSTTSFAKEYYKWVDSKGSTHYTTTPPPKNAKKRGKIDTYGSTSYTQHTAPSTAQNSNTDVAPTQNTNVQPQQPSGIVIPQNAAPRTEASRIEPPRLSDPQ